MPVMVSRIAEPANLTRATGCEIAGEAIATIPGRYQ